ncbi:hypothetical protein HXT42_02335 [Gardnerella sp. DNF01192]|uniref:hypothetical protein n=1 Tax=Gardnerella sp. DNF01192 TaxID=2749064 RepID=UPI003BAA1010
MNASTMNSQNAVNMNQMQAQMQFSASLKRNTRYHLTFANVLKSETIKLAYAKFTWWCTALFIILPIISASLLSSIIHALIPAGMSPSILLAQGYQSAQSCGGLYKSNGFWHYRDCNGKQHFIDAVKNAASLFCIPLALSALIIVIVFASKAATQDRKRGSIRSSVIAVPRRNLLIFARLTVVVFYAFIMQIISMIVLNIALSAMFSDFYMPFDPQRKCLFSVSIAMMILSAICMVLSAIMGYGIALICKSAAAGTLWLVLSQMAIALITIVALISTIINGVTHFSAMYSYALYSSYGMSNPLMLLISNPAVTGSLNILQMLPSYAASNFLLDAELHLSNWTIFIPNFMISLLYMIIWAALFYGIGHTVERMRNIMK